MNALFYVPQMAAYGGMERHVCILAREATRRRHRVRLLTTSNSLNATARAELTGAGVELREMSRPRGSARQIEKMLWLWRETWRARRDAWDLIYTNGQSSLARTVWHAGRGRARIIHHHHTAADAAEQSTWAPGFRRVLTKAPEIVACSETTRAGIEDATGRSGVRFLPYFTACPVARENVTEKIYRSDAPLNFGFVGRLVATKGIDTLCALSQRPEMRGVTWHIHGEGPEYPPAVFEPLPNVRYHGSYRDLAAYGKILLGLDALVLFTRHNEGMPLSLIEAMSAGLPWMATDRGGTRELALDAANCVLIANPENALPSAIDLVSRLREGRTSRCAQREVYDAHFAPEVVARRWFSFLENPPLQPSAVPAAVQSS